MKVLNLTKGSKVYTSNVFLILGDWNAIEDVNTLVDAGRDPLLLNAINKVSTGVGKHQIEQVVLTHCHYDHANLVPQIKETYGAKAFAYTSSLVGIDVILKGGEQLRMGDRYFEVLYTPGHSSDSICLYCAAEKVLFSGDTPVSVVTPGGSHEEGFVQALEGLCRRDIETIYPGHGDPILDGNALLRRTLKNVRSGRIIPNNEGKENRG
ncbi:MAG TPA: MBL fold metallo-hydrolase [Cyanobacteria bacterium UBA8530]|nr:MBL fold metallo-hydrolase [Cyanobacteria bacterium UBA8530]